MDENNLNRSWNLFEANYTIISIDRVPVDGFFASNHCDRYKKKFLSCHGNKFLKIWMILRRCMILLLLTKVKLVVYWFVCSIRKVSCVVCLRGIKRI